MSEIRLNGAVKYSIRFEITDLVALIQEREKEWLALTEQALFDRGAYGEEDRLPVFLDDYLETRLEVYGSDGPFLRFTIDWNETDYRWTRDDIDSLMDALPQHLRFEDGEPAKSIIGPDDVPLPGI